MSRFRSAQNVLENMDQSFDGSENGNTAEPVHLHVLQNAAIIPIDLDLFDTDVEGQNGDQHVLPSSPMILPSQQATNRDSDDDYNPENSSHDGSSNSDTEQEGLESKKHLKIELSPMNNVSPIL